MSNNEEKNTQNTQKETSLGDVQIADEVVAIIAALAASDVEGVESMAGIVRSDFANKVGSRSLAKGVKVEVINGVVTVMLSILVKYDFSIIEVSEKVQQKVKATIENMTGLQVADVNIKIAGVEMDDRSKA